MNSNIKIAIPELNLSIVDNDKGEFVILKKTFFKNEKVLINKNTKKECIFKDKESAFNYISEVFKCPANKLIDQNSETYYEYEKSGLFISKNLLGEYCVAKKDFSGKYLIQYSNYWNVPVIKDNEKDIALAIPYIIRG